MNESLKPVVKAEMLIRQPVAEVFAAFADPAITAKFWFSKEWTFTARPDNTTFVSTKNSGFQGEPTAVVQQAIDATEGFTFVLAGAKAWLEHGIQLNLVADRHPDGVGEG